jgi:electron transport complex protein RnfG
VSVLKQLWLVLVLAVGLGSALAAVDRSLQPRIQENKDARLGAAILEVVPAGAKYTKEELAGQDVYRVTDEGGQFVGWAVPASTMGFGDVIEMMIGVTPDGQKILGLAVLESRETPGLGAHIRDAHFRDQFKGLSTAATIQVVKSGQTAPDSIDAITGATISSRAVTNGVNRTMHEVKEALVAAAAGGGTSP